MSHVNYLYIICETLVNVKRNSNIGNSSLARNIILNPTNNMEYNKYLKYQIPGKMIIGSNQTNHSCIFPSTSRRHQQAINEREIYPFQLRRKPEINIINGFEYGNRTAKTEMNYDMSQVKDNSTLQENPEKNTSQQINQTENTDNQQNQKYMLDREDK